MKLRTLREFYNPKVKLLLYGVSGVGKTRLACSMPKPFLMDFENGLLSARGILPPDYEIFQPQSWDDLLQAVSTLRTSSGGYESLVVDSFTAAERTIMASVLKLSKREHPALQDWGFAAERTRNLISWINDLNMHTCFVCLEQTTKNDLTGQVKCEPLLPGKLANEAPAHFDEVFHMRREFDPKGKTTKPVLLTSPDGIHVAKDRSGKLELFEEPNWETIYNKIVFKQEEG